MLRKQGEKIGQAVGIPKWLSQRIDDLATCLCNGSIEVPARQRIRHGTVHHPQYGRSTTCLLYTSTYAYDVKGSGDLVLTTLSGAEHNLGRLRLADASMYLVTEERESGAVVAELTTTRNQGVIALPRGKYFIQRRGSYEFREYQIELVPGQEVDLASLPYRSVRYDQLVRKRGGARTSVHGLNLLLGGRGEILAGQGPTPNVLLGYAAGLPWLTVGARLRGSTASLVSIDGGLASRQYELGLSAVLQRYVDLPWFSLAFGVAIEGTWYTPVSYTHLDVYKRQAHCLCLHRGTDREFRVQRGPFGSSRDSMWICHHRR